MDSRHQYLFILDAGFIGQNVGQRDRVIDIGGRLDVFTPLIAVLVSGERYGANDSVHVISLAKPQQPRPDNPGMSQATPGSAAVDFHRILTQGFHLKLTRQLSA
jgi:hypothetical protein